ncbi:MAG: hypothetical protein RID23_01865 [Roseovarius sp.]
MMPVSAPLKLSAASMRMAGYVIESNLRIAQVFGRAALETNPFMGRSYTSAGRSVPKAAVPAVPDVAEVTPAVEKKAAPAKPAAEKPATPAVKKAEAKPAAVKTAEAKPAKDELKAEAKTAAKPAKDEPKAEAKPAAKPAKEAPKAEAKPAAKPAKEAPKADAKPDAPAQEAAGTPEKGASTGPESGEPVAKRTRKPSVPPAMPPNGSGKTGV